MNAHWFTVGAFLKIDYHKLEAIKKENHDQCIDCLRAMLATWLRGTDHASPTALVQALRSVGMVALANTVATNHGEQFSMNECMCPFIICKIMQV